jgi:hypothetical protein
VSEFIHKAFHDISWKEFRRIHWRRYFTRKVVILGTFAIAGGIAGHYVHAWFINKGAEIAFGTIAEHLLFEIPITEEA